MKELIANKDLEIQNLNEIADNNKAIGKKQRKKWIKNAIYGTGGGLVVGVIAGILIAK